jgi:hypothetical protein
MRRPPTSAGVEFHPDPARKTAVLASRLIGHPLSDGNKRVGSLCAIELVARNGGTWTRRTGLPSSVPCRAATPSPWFRCRPLRPGGWLGCGGGVEDAQGVEVVRLLEVDDEVGEPLNRVRPQSRPVEFDGVAGGTGPGLPGDEPEGLLDGVDEPTCRGGVDLCCSEPLSRADPGWRACAGRPATPHPPDAASTPSRR